MRYLLSLCALGLCAGAALPAELGQVQSVYLLPMAGGLDQMLANRLTQLKVFRVVADPKLADAVFTDSLGVRFQERMSELYPAEPAPPPPAAAAKPADAVKEGKPAEPGTDEAEAKRLAELKEMYKPQGSSWSRGKGTVFLVDRRSKHVLWSTFDEPGDRRPRGLDALAERVVKRLKKDLGQP
ncbi:MAG TPA: hypothetical protein DEH78_27835 [Solibacterales bacterium]|nr:hypothetical protein [Bryobacterales bacterium]